MHLKGVKCRNQLGVLLPVIAVHFLTYLLVYVKLNKLIQVAFMFCEMLTSCTIKYALQYVRSLSILNAEGSESLDENMSAKKRRISVSTEEELGNSLERKDAADDFGEPGNSLSLVF